MKRESDWNKLLTIPQDSYIEIELRDGNILQFKKYEGISSNDKLNFTRFEDALVTEYSIFDISKWRTLIEEPKPFDWRGKNIQWVKHNNYDAALKVVYLSDVGIGITNPTNDKEELNAPEVWPWEKAKAWFEWSEDNQTWRKFE